jgi:hypothetical protein
MHISHHDNNTLLPLTCKSGLKTNPETAQHNFTHTLVGKHGSFWGQHQYVQNLHQKCRRKQNEVFCDVTSCNTVHMEEPLPLSSGLSVLYDVTTQESKT